MSYYLDFHPKALKEWKKLDNSTKEQFYKKLKTRLENPNVSKDRLSGYQNLFKIKLKDKGYRLVYEVKEKEIVVYVIAVGKRENNTVYNNLEDRT